MPNCRSCEAEVVFVPSAKSGKQMILDAKPAKRVVLVGVPGAPDLDPIIGAKPSDDTGELPGRRSSEVHVFAEVHDTYVDHHATCPHAEAWR